MFEADSFDWRHGLYDPISGVSDMPLPLETLHGPYAFPRLAGIKLRGVNLSHPVTFAYSGNGPNTPTAMPFISYDMLYDIGINGPTDPSWTHWLKPNIDLMHSLGCNCIRFIFDPSVRVGDASHHGPATFRGALTAPQFAAVLDLFITYLASLGMYFYPAAAEPQCVDALTPAMVTAYVTEFVAVVSSTSYHNVIGIDLIQEFGRSTYAMTAGVLNALMTTARAALLTPLPITNSFYLAGSFAFSFVSLLTTLPVGLASGIDYLDFHCYLYSEALLYNLLVTNTSNLPVVIGESGIGYNGFYFDESQPIQETVHPYSSELRGRHYQDLVAGLGRAFHHQLVSTWNAVDEWTTPGQRWGLYGATQDGSYTFTDPHAEMVAPYQTIQVAPVAYDAEYVLDLTGGDTVASNYAAGTTFALGGGQQDNSGTFARNAHRVKRPNGAIGVGVLSYANLPSINQSVSVDFDATQSTPSGGQIVWGVSVRHRGDTVLNLAPTTYYFGFIQSKAGDPNDGLMGIFAIKGVSFTLVTSTTAVLPFNLLHSYRFSLAASGTYPTTLTAVLSDLTLSTTVATLVGTDATPALQALGVPGLPTQIGEVYYTNVRYVSTNDAGPSIASPTITAVTSTTVALSWTAAGGTAPLAYVVQYATLDSHRQVSSAWTSQLAQTATTATVTGVTPLSVDYAFRIQVMDASADPLRVAA